MRRQTIKKLLALTLAAAMLAAVIPAAQALGMSYTPSAEYAASVYCSQLNGVGASGNPRLDLVNAAVSQLGYHEGDSASELGGGNPTGTHDYTEYGYWYGREILDKPAGHMGPWCAMFVSWCARQAGIPSDVISNACYARVGTTNPYYFINIDFIEGHDHEPVPGDLVFFDWPNQSGEWNHVAIVYCTDGERVYTLEGNTMHNNVEIRAFSLDEPIIKGYAVPRYENDPGASIAPDDELLGMTTYDYFDPVNHYKPVGTIGPGSSDSGVSWLQAALSVLGYPVYPSGTFDEETEAALIAFQQDHGLEADGVCTLATAAYIQSLLDELNEPEPTPVPTDEPIETPEPTDEPIETPEPTDEPIETPEPTDEPIETPEPTDEPIETPEPTDEPIETPEPTDEPIETPEPTDEPIETPEPTDEPIVTPEPTDEPIVTPEPTDEPIETPEPTDEPIVTPEPTYDPSFDPTDPANYPVPERMLHYGCSGEDVKWLQAALTRLGYPLEINGFFGSLTYMALKDFQRDYGLEVTGVCDDITREELLFWVLPWLDGDADRDGIYSTTDALLILRHALEISFLDPRIAAHMDLNHDGTINTADALAALRIALGIIPPPEPEEN